MKNKRLINWLCLSGIISIIFYLMHDIIGAMYYPNYNWLSQAVSDLTATDAPSYIIASSLSSIYELFSCICCILVSILQEKEENKMIKIGIYLFSIMNFVSAIGYSLFPLSSTGYESNSFQSIMHVYVVTILVIVLSIISLILIAIGSFKGKNKHKLLGTLAIISLVLMFIGAVGSANVPKEYFGVIERFSTYSAVVFTAILGLYGFNAKE